MGRENHGIPEGGGSSETSIGAWVDAWGPVTSLRESKGAGLSSEERPGPEEMAAGAQGECVV